MRDDYFIEVHCLQTVPPSCANRDEAGLPKVCTFGGDLRGRYSSQSLKRNMREGMNENEKGVRTAKIEELLAEEIQRQEEISKDEAVEKSIDAIKKIDLSDNVLHFISQDQVRRIAELEINDNQDKQAYQEAYIQNPSGDMLFFGRMEAGKDHYSYEAACSVAHALSTHKVAAESDFFTALDDCKTDSTGAAHLSERDFLSATFYKYANMNASLLWRNLVRYSDDSDRKMLQKRFNDLIDEFTEGFITALPQGHMHSYASVSYPYAVYVTLTKTPANLSGAFVDAVRPDESDSIEKSSSKRLVKCAQEFYDTYEKRPIMTKTLGSSLKKLGENMTLKQLKKTLIQCVNKELFQADNTEADLGME